MNKTVLSSIMIIITALSLSAEANKWEEIRNEDGIKVYIREYPGSNIVETFGETVIDARVEVIAEVLGDVPCQPEWMKDVKEVRIVKNIGKFENIVYYFMDSPWPVKDRDMLVDALAYPDNDTARIIVKAKAMCRDFIVPEKKDCIRITDMTSAWVLECDLQNRNKTKVFYTTRADVGGMIPDFLINLGNKENTFNLMKELRRMTAKQKYIDRGVTSPGRKDIDALYRSKENMEKVRGNRKKIMPEEQMRQ